MKLIIAGSRNLTDEKLIRSRIHDIISKFFVPVTDIVSGCAIGVDRIGESYANMMGIPLVKMPADWNKHGKSAGPIRNREMSYAADAAIVFWDGKSPGSKNMISEMSKRNKPCMVVMLDD